MQSTNLNVSPMFEDFDENKNFNRVLFNAGRTVQARELTQAQSILQNQIERLGKHLFTEGAMVVPGGIRAVESQDVAKLTMKNGSLFTDFGSEAEIYLKSTANGLIAKIAKSFNATSTDPISVFYDVITPGSNQEKKFVPNEEVTIFKYGTGTNIITLATATATTLAKGSWVKVQSGVYFVRGMLVRTDDQDYVVSKYTTDRTVKVGFNVIESIVTSAEDPSLLSNANGFPNQGAPGASRLKVVLVLTGLDITAVSSDFIEIARFEDGALQSKVDYTSYSIIEQAIAKRTYETNGDYVVNEFGMDIKEHLKTDTNGGAYLPINGGDETKMVAAMKPGIGYIKGYRVENIGIQNAVFDKARDTAFLNNAAFTADYGQYFLVKDMKSVPDIDIKKRVLLLDSGNVQIGTCAVRAIRKDGTNYRIYVFDVVTIAGKFVYDAASLKYSDSSSLFTANLVASVLYDTNKSSLLFKLPVSAIKTLYTPGLGGDTSYTVLRTFNLTTNASGVVSASVGSNEFFGAIDPNTYFIALTGAASAGTIFDPSTSITLGGTILGTTMSINLGSAQGNQSIKVIAPVLKSQTTQKTKTLVTITDEVIQFPDTNRQRFSKADIYDVISVKDRDTNEDLTALFTFEDGQKDSWYETGKLVKTDSQLITRFVKVTYRYFAHSAGDYFTVDSYSGLTRPQVTSFGGDNLSDYIDFRPLKDANNVFTSATVFGEIIKPGDSIRADITYYLPRADIVCVNTNGVFLVTKGLPSLSPVIPSTPEDAVKLYELLIPAYTMKPTDITIKTVDNSRYTMRDIGKLDARISNLEYYTTLSALETATNKTEVLDPVTGNNRFKNGFAVDGFKDFRLAEVAHPEWSASMDLNAGILHPTFEENGVGFTTSDTSNVVKPTRVYMKSYTETEIIDQPYATMTININPYAVFAWLGKVSLTPDRDYWRDVKYNEPIIINNTLDMTEGKVEGTVWSSWDGVTAANRLPGHSDWRWRQKISTESTTSFQNDLYSSSTDNSVSTSIIPFMRSIPIVFECTGFRPFTRIYPFWDSVDVSSECAPTGGVYGQAVITDAAGKTTGTYLVPDNDTKRFKTGESVMRFTDSSTDSVDPNVLTTYGSTTFLSGGIFETRQVTTTNTTVITATTVPTGGVRYLDPIAQTFLVPTPGGCFATSFDIYFATKARSIPVTLELRTASSGIPTSAVLASVTLDPSQVSVSSDGTVPTTFKFVDPIMLSEGMEYAVVLVANTQEYNVFIAQQGQNIIGSQMALSKQAHMGVFLVSANGSTWDAQQDRDLKFKLRRAVFSTNPGVVTLDCDAPIPLPLAFNAAYTNAGSNLVKVTLQSHGLKVGDSVTMSGVVPGNNLVDSGVNGTKVVIAADIDTFSYQATSTANVTGSLGGSAMRAVVNYPYNIFMNNVDSYTPPGTKVTWEYQATSQSTRAKTGWFPLNVKTDMTLSSEGVIRKAGDLQIRATMTSSVDNVCPMIESSGFNAVLVSPRVDGVSKVFTYVSKDIKFDNPNTTARFYVGARLPGNSGLKMYHKRMNSADQDIGSMPWVELTATTPIANSESYVEYEYQINGSFIGYKLKLELTGSRDNAPSLSDIRSLAFA